MTDATSKRIAQWPTLRGATLVVSLQEPVPGERFVDIRRWHGEAGADLVPGLQGITLAATELPELRKALSDLGVDAGPAEQPSAPRAAEPEPVDALAVAALVAGEAGSPAPVHATVADAGDEPGVEAEPEVPEAAVPARAGRRGISRIWR